MSSLSSIAVVPTMLPSVAGKMNTTKHVPKADQIAATAHFRSNLGELPRFSIRTGALSQYFGLQKRSSTDTDLPALNIERYKDIRGRNTVLGCLLDIRSSALPKRGVTTWPTRVYDQTLPHTLQDDSIIVEHFTFDIQFGTLPNSCRPDN